MLRKNDECRSTNDELMTKGTNFQKIREFTH